MLNWLLPGIVHINTRFCLCCAVVSLLSPFLVCFVSFRRQDAERLRRHQDPSVPFLPAYAIDAKPPLSAMQRGQSVPAHMQRVVAAGIEQLESLPESPRSPRRAFAPQSGSLASLLVLPPPPQALRRAAQLEQELEFSQKDREELVAYTNELRRRLERMQQRELELSAKMKENIALVEQTHTELGVARQQKTAVEEKVVSSARAETHAFL